MIKVYFRILLLISGPNFGSADGLHRFTIHRDFWREICMGFFGRNRHRMTESVSEKQAAMVADDFERREPDVLWRQHLRLWGDRRGKTAKLFVKFLRGGAFFVRDTTQCESQEFSGRVLKLRIEK